MCCCICVDYRFNAIRFDRLNESGQYSTSQPLGPYPILLPITFMQDRLSFYSCSQLYRTVTAILANRLLLAQGSSSATGAAQVSGRHHSQADLTVGNETLLLGSSVVEETPEWTTSTAAHEAVSHSDADTAMQDGNNDTSSCSSAPSRSTATPSTQNPQPTRKWRLLVHGRSRSTNLSAGGPVPPVLSSAAGALAGGRHAASSALRSIGNFLSGGSSRKDPAEDPSMSPEGGPTPVVTGIASSSSNNSRHYYSANDHFELPDSETQCISNFIDFSKNPQSYFVTKVSCNCCWLSE